MSGYSNGVISHLVDFMSFLMHMFFLTKVIFSSPSLLKELGFDTAYTCKDTHLIFFLFCFLIVSVSEALFSLCCDTYFSTLCGVCPTFRSRITAIILFFIF